MRRNLLLYAHLIRAAVLGKLQYRLDFAVGMLNILILNAINIVLIGILVLNYHTLGGWGLWDLMFLYSLWMLTRGIYQTFFWHITDLEELIVSGGFDAYLTRPMSPFLQLLGRDINHMGLGDALVGTLTFALSYRQLGLSWGLGEWGYYLLCILSGATIELSITLACSSLCFWTVRAQAVQNVAERFVVLMQQYPVNIFGRWFQVFVTCFLPVAFINYYPSVAFLGKTQQGTPPWLYASPLVAALALALSALIWTRGVRRYAGTGS